MTTCTIPNCRGFASDNYAGVHPEVLAAHRRRERRPPDLLRRGRLHRATCSEVVREHFGDRRRGLPGVQRHRRQRRRAHQPCCRAGAPSSRRRTAHIHTDEGGAPEKMAGLKLFTVPTPDGKLTPELIATEAWGWGDEHRAQPLAVSITQTTELGTLYTPDEVRAIADYAHAHGMALHMDGARIWNAAAALGVPFRAFTTDAGVDILSFGGTKNGLLGAEAVVVLDPDRVDGLSTCARPPCSSPPRCASSPRSCSRCSTATSGCARPATRTRWRRACAARSRPASPTARSRASRSPSRPRRTRCSRCCRTTRRRPHPRARALLRLGSRARRGALDVRVRHHRGRRRRFVAVIREELAARDRPIAGSALARLLRPGRPARDRRCRTGRSPT